MSLPLPDLTRLLLEPGVVLRTPSALIKTLCEYLAWYAVKCEPARITLYFALDSMDHGISAERGGHAEMGNKKGEDWWLEFEKQYFEKVAEGHSGKA